MLARAKIVSILPKKYREQSTILTVESLSELEDGIKRINDQTSAAWFIISLAIYSVIYDGELYTSSGLTWRQYRSETRERFGMDYQDFSEALSAGKFIQEHGRELFAAGWKPERSMRKLARANLALKICGDPSMVIDHLVNDQWIDFKAWYAGLKNTLIPGPIDKSQVSQGQRVIEIKRGKILIDGVEPVTIADTVPADEKKELLDLIRAFYKEKAAKAV